jgi:predicted small lipoprotein YifL
MKKLFITVFLVAAVLLSGCGSKTPVVTVPPLSTTTTSTTHTTTWADVANLPVGTVVVLTGYCTFGVPAVRDTVEIKPSGGLIYDRFALLQAKNNMASYYIVIPKNGAPVEGAYLRVKAKINEYGILLEISRTIIH